MKIIDKIYDIEEVRPLEKQTEEYRKLMTTKPDKSKYLIIHIIMTYILSPLIWNLGSIVLKIVKIPYPVTTTCSSTKKNGLYHE